MQSTKKIPVTHLNNGASMPQVGFGLWQIRDRDACINAVTTALDAGYRHFDTAQIYGNEQYLAEALSTSGIDRSDTFITTKISVRNFLQVDKSFETSLQKLETDYVDLLLLHFPVTALRGRAWKRLEELNRAGKARAIGVSNYTVRHLKQLLDTCAIKPAVNQVELHVFLQQPELLAFCDEQGIVVQAYSPLAHGHGLDDRVLGAIAQKHNKTSAQIMLRWCIEMGTVPLPKSVTQARIYENLDIFDFELSVEDMQQLQALDRNFRTCWDPTRTP